MALTVDQAVARVVGRLRAKLAFVALSVTPDHTNADLTPAVADACWYFEVLPADYPAVSDADLATIADPKRFLDAATLETLYVVRGAFAEVDETAEKNSQKLDQFDKQVAAMIADYEGRVPRPNYPRGAIGFMPDPCPPDPCQYAPGPASQSPPFNPDPMPYGPGYDYRMGYPYP